MSQGPRDGGFSRHEKVRPRRLATLATPGAAAGGGKRLPTHPTLLAMRLALELAPAWRVFWNIKSLRRAALFCLEGGLPGRQRQTRRGGWQRQLQQQQWRGWKPQKR